MIPQKEANHLSDLLKSVGVKRITPAAGEQKVDSVGARSKGTVFISTVGPYNPALFSNGKFSAEKAMVDGYLEIHAKLVSSGLPSILIILDDFARGALVSTGAYLLESAIVELVSRITAYSIDFIKNATGTSPSQNQFQVVRESLYSDLRSVELLRSLAEIEVSPKDKKFAGLDVKSALDQIKLQKKCPGGALVASSIFGSSYSPILLEWEVTVKFWQAAGIKNTVPLAEVATFPGSRNTREFYQAGFEELAQV